MNFIILYPAENPTPEQFPVARIIPALGANVVEVARKDVPAGVPYLIVTEADMPTEEREWQTAMTVDFSEPDGYGIGPDAWFAEQEQKQKLKEALPNGNP